MPTQLAVSLVELEAGIRSRTLRQGYDRYEPTDALSKVKPKGFAREFAAHFQQE